MMKHYKVSPRMAQAVTHNGVVHIAGQSPTIARRASRIKRATWLAKLRYYVIRDGAVPSVLLIAGITATNIDAIVPGAAHRQA